MENKTIYGELKNFYSTKIENLLENYKTIGNDYTILGFDKDKAFILSHRNGAMYLVEGAERVNRLDINTQEYEDRFKASVRSFVDAAMGDSQASVNIKKRELYESLNEQLYLFSLPCQGAVPISESVRKKIFDKMMENQLFVEYLTGLGKKIKNNQTVLIEAIPYLGLRARDKLIKFFREQIDLTYDQARTAAVAILNLAFGKQFNENFNVKNLYRSINSVLPPKKSRELTYFILETAGKALLNEFKVIPPAAGGTAKLSPIQAAVNDTIELEADGEALDSKGYSLSKGKYKVTASDKEKGVTVTGPDGKTYEGVGTRVIKESKTYLIEAEETLEDIENPEGSDSPEIIDESPAVSNEEELQNALTILKRVFKDEVEDLSVSTEETFGENEKGFKKLMASITSLEKYLADLHAEADIDETDEAVGDEDEEGFEDIEAPPKKKAPDVDIEDVIETEEPTKEEEQKIEDILETTDTEGEVPPAEEKSKVKGKSFEELLSEEAGDEGEPVEDENAAPEYEEFDPNAEEVETPAEAPEYPPEGEDEFAQDETPDEAPAFDEGFAGEEKSKTITLGDAFIFDSDDAITDTEGVKLTPEEVYTVVAIDEEKNEVALANEKGVKVIVGSDNLISYNNYFSPVKSLSEGTVLEVIDENILDDNDQPLPMGEYELMSMDDDSNIAKVANTETHKMYTLSLNNLGNMGVVKALEEDIEVPGEEGEIIPDEPEKTEYPEEAYDETASEVAQVVDTTASAPEVPVNVDGDDKIEITIKIPPDQVEGTKVEDLLFNLTQKKEPGVDNPEENYNKLYGTTEGEGEMEEIEESEIPPQLAHGDDKEALSLYKSLLSVEHNIKKYAEEHKDIYQLEEEVGKYTALIDRLKTELLDATDSVKKDVRDFLETIRDEVDDVVDEDTPAPSIEADEEGKI